jgi:hypothetical protein
MMTARKWRRQMREEFLFVSDAEQYLARKGFTWTHNEGAARMFVLPSGIRAALTFTGATAFPAVVVIS